MSIAVGMIETLGFPAVVEAELRNGESRPRHLSWIRKNRQWSRYRSWKRKGSPSLSFC